MRLNEEGLRLPWHGGISFATHAVLALVWFDVFALVAACATVKDDASLDSWTDTGIDTSGDSSIDTAYDPGVDPTWDTVEDTGYDTATDTSIDSGTDTSVDSFVDTATDTSTDTATDTLIDTATDTLIDTGTDPVTDPADPCAAAIAVFDYDFEGAGGCSTWTHSSWTGSGCGGYDSWQCGSVLGWPNNPSGSTSSWGTDLSSSGFPANLECSYVASPAIDLSSCSGRTLYLDFRAAYSIEDYSSSCRDGGFVQVNDADTAASNWSSVDGGYDHLCTGCHHLDDTLAWCGYDVTWQDVRVNVSAYARVAFQARFLIEYDAGYPWGGLFVDDVRLTLGP